MRSRAEAGVSAYDRLLPCVTARERCWLVLAKPIESQ